MRTAAKRILKAGMGAALFLFTAITVPALSADSSLGDGLFARIATTRGEIVLCLEYRKAPMAVCNFAGLAEGKMNAAGGEPFFNGLPFHRVVEGFLIQGGDPLGDDPRYSGQGGPGYRFFDEVNGSLRHDRPGILSMANAGPNTNGSQFVITRAAAPHLDGKHTVFGHVVQGQNVVNAVRQGDRIDKVTIIRNGEEAAAFRADQEFFDALVRNAASAESARLRLQRAADIALVERKYPGASISPSGLRWVVTKTGTSPRPAPGSTAVVNLKGMLLSGRYFDNSDLSGGARRFRVGTGTIFLRGLEEAIMDMAAGERRTVIVPPELAYGNQQVGNIPPASFLIFELELVRVE